MKPSSPNVLIGDPALSEDDLPTENFGNDELRMLFRVRIKIILQCRDDALGRQLLVFRRH